MARWDITTAGAAFEFETTLLNAPTKPFALDANHFFVSYRGSGSDGFASVFAINTSTWAVTEASTIEHDTQNQLWTTACQIDTNHFIIWYLGSTATTDAHAQVFAVNTTTWAITTASSRFLFDTDVGSYHSAAKIDDNHFINFWSGAGAGGYAQVFTVNTTTWAVTTANANLEFDTTQGTYNSCQKIDDNHFINFWAGSGSDGYTQVFTVNTTTWAVTTANSWLEFDTQNSIWNAAYKLDDNHFINFWSDIDVDGKCQVFTVNTTTWAVTTANSVLEFDTQMYQTNTSDSIAQIDSNHFLHVWAGPDTAASTAYDGFAQVFEVNTSTWAVTTAGAPFEFDATQGEYNAISELIAGYDNKFLNIWSGSGDDGYAQVLSVDIDIPATPGEFEGKALREDGNLLAYYRLENNCLDTAGTNDLTNYNSVGYVAAKYGTGADFGTLNTNKYLGTANALGIDGGSITIAGWFRSYNNIAGSPVCFVNQANNTSKTGYGVFHTGGTLITFFRMKANVAYDSVTYPISIGTDNFNHYAVTYDGTSVVGYMNGTATGTTASSGNGNTVAVSTGVYLGVEWSGNYFTSGLLDDVVFFNRALSEAEVQQICPLPGVPGAYAGFRSLLGVGL